MDLKEFVRGQPETELHYLADSYARSISSNLIKITPDKKNVYFLLDRTIFHPKSGGQPSDCGRLSGGGFKLDVKKAMMVSGAIVHWAKIEDNQPTPGQVMSEIDWDLRYLYMRRHSAAHLFDHCLSRVTGNNVETTDSWVGDNSYVGYAGATPSDGQLSEAEEMENRMISKGGIISSSYVSKEALAKTAPNAPNIYRLPDLNRLRVVTIEGCNPIPCGGTHTRNITEIGQFRLLRAAPLDSGFRIHFNVA